MRRFGKMTVENPIFQKLTGRSALSGGVIQPFVGLPRPALSRFPVPTTPIYRMESGTTLSVIDLRHRAGLLNIGEVAELIGLPERRFRYLLESQRVFRPQVRLDRHRRGYYTADDIARIRDLICGLQIEGGGA